MALGTVNTGDPIRAVDHNSLYNVLKGVSGSGEILSFLWQGADLASASTLVLGSDGNYFHITGTTTITAIGTQTKGTMAILEFTGACPITHNGTSLILFGAASVTTVAGDVHIFVSEGSGNWREVGRMSLATIAVPGDMAAVDKQIVTSQAVTGGTVTVDFSKGAVYVLTTNANVAITLTNGLLNQPHMIVIEYDGTRTVTFSTTVNWPGGVTPVWTSADDITDIVTLFWDGTDWYGDTSLNHVHS